MTCDHQIIRIPSPEKIILENFQWRTQSTQSGNTIVSVCYLDVLNSIFLNVAPRKRYLMMLKPEKFNVTNPGERYDFWILRLIGKDAFKAAYCKTDKKWNRIAYFIWTDDAAVVTKLSFVTKEIWMIIGNNGWCYDTLTKTAI